MLADAGSTPAASTKNRKGSPQGGPFLFLAAVTYEPAPEGKGGRSEAEVFRATAKAQTPAASTKRGKGSLKKAALLAFNGTGERLNSRRYGAGNQHDLSVPRLGSIWSHRGSINLRCDVVKPDGHSQSALFHNRIGTLT